MRKKKAPPEPDGQSKIPYFSGAPKRPRGEVIGRDTKRDGAVTKITLFYDSGDREVHELVAGMKVKAEVIFSKG